MRKAAGRSYRQALDKATLLEVAREITGGAESHDEIDVLLRLEAIDELSDMFVLDAFEQTDFGFQVVEQLARQLLAGDRLDSDRIPELRCVAAAAAAALDELVAFEDSRKRATPNFFPYFKRPNALIVRGCCC